MVYPTFDINSIQKRLNNDLEQFSKEYQVRLDLGFDVESSRFEEMKEKIDSLMNKLVEYTEHKNKDIFNYAHDVKYVEEYQQKLMWITRTYIFYQLLAYVSKSLSDKNLYNDLYSDHNEYPYRDNISQKLNLFKMGIFGSITPQSDIDLGIMYTGEPYEVNNEPALSYVLSRFENIFLKLTGLNSLSFDIETYADMITITKNIEGENKDIFYINTNLIEDKDKHKGLICALTSVLRSMALAEQEIQNKNLDRNELNDLFENFKFDNIIETIHDTRNKITDIVEENKSKIFKDFYDKQGKYLKESKDSEIINYSENLKKAKELVIDYMTLDYDAKRYKYYEYVNKAEKLKFDIMKKMNNNDELTSEDISNLIYKIGVALTYRMESYTCSPTIVYIVRILQAEKDKSEKYHTTTPEEYCNDSNKDQPYCTMSKYGFILSCIEQIGNIYRFYKTYCMENDNPNMCKKKLTKYYGRFIHSYGFIKRYDRLRETIRNTAMLMKNNPFNISSIYNQGNSNQSNNNIVSGGKYKKYLNAKNNKKSRNRKSRNKKSRNRKPSNRKSRNRKSRNRKSRNRKSHNRKSK